MFLSVSKILMNFQWLQSSTFFSIGGQCSLGTRLRGTHSSTFWAGLIFQPPFHLGLEVSFIIFSCLITKGASVSTRFCCKLICLGFGSRNVLVSLGWIRQIKISFNNTRDLGALSNLTAAAWCLPKDYQTAMMTAYGLAAVWGLQKASCTCKLAIKS